MVRLLDIRTHQETVLAHPLPVSGVAYSPDGKTLASGCMDNTITLWRTQTDKASNTVTGSELLFEPLRPAETNDVTALPP